MSALKTGVYAVGAFSIIDPTPAQQAAMLTTAQDVAAAGFNLVMLASMHVHVDGSIYLDDALMFGPTPSQVSPNLGACIDAMTASGGTVLMSIGGGGKFHGEAVGWYDFTDIGNLITKYPNPDENPFFQNLTQMFAAYPGIGGLDLDLESYQGYDQFLDTMIAVVRWVVAQGKIAVLCPYEDPAFWANVVNRTKDPSGDNIVSWINLQNAAGNMSQFQGPLQAVGIGVDAITAGLQIDGMTLSEVQQYFSDFGSSYPGLGGGWLWTLGAIVPASQYNAYAEAITTGLS